MPKKRMPVAERQQEGFPCSGCFSKAVAGGELAGYQRMTGPERVLTWAGELVKNEAERRPEPRDKLDTAR